MLACDSSCKSCSAGASTDCTSCSAPTYLHQSSCIASCPVGYYGENTTNTCESKSIFSHLDLSYLFTHIACDTSCHSCIDSNYQNCTSCVGDTYLYQSMCTECPEIGYWPDTSDNICKSNQSLQFPHIILNLASSFFQSVIPPVKVAQQGHLPAAQVVSQTHICISPLVMMIAPSLDSMRMIPPMFVRVSQPFLTSILLIYSSL